MLTHKQFLNIVNRLDRIIELLESKPDSAFRSDFVVGLPNDVCICDKLKEVTGGFCPVHGDKKCIN